MPADPTVTIDAADLEPAAAYRLLTGVVVPRPIAWVSTVDERGVPNLAPFSAFTMVSNDPPMVGINIGRRGGERKDTARNIHATGEYVVNIARWDDHELVHESSRAMPRGADEAAELGIRLAPADVVRAPRVAHAPVSLECRFARAVEFGRGGAEFTVGEIVRFHVLAELLDNGKIDTAALDPAARIAGPSYSRLGTTRTLRPVPVALEVPAH
ncbi:MULTISPECIES: flavin reductase family protein [Pseudonocardia]|uniref:Flavin reductase like domain protein n=2 Tax=Pseudonocardia TaxID=1847 RepID=A0A1Y2MYZ2_PSEAH|nr:MULTISPECIES: flavin reductase family protein [Pseudonocardia]OSY40393.1 Flavin reductase like domain protein [Pseudonocardia autotrophica]TDN72276.1 flavin reductase (DIM6/NTAB) family NADH-FMN oxidoreductase RutF [Pseudonocardia autotrophica]BBG02988.1 flavin reductase [Pseudonocardia autotrophica]GEC25111.1 flavin reductase [Pseudonocardia saturnea]